MITIVVVKNAFEPEKGREVHKVEYEKSKNAVSAYISEYETVFGGAEYTIVLNSNTAAATDSVADGDFIVLAPHVGKGGGKNPLIIVAAIALSVYSMGLAAHVAGVTAATGWAGVSSMAALGGYLAAAAVMFVGGSLIQRVFGTAAETANMSSENPTYSWSGITTTTGQNGPISVFYGTVRTGGQTLGKYLTSVDDKQYLNWLVAAGEGPLTISDIQLNDNPIGNFDKVTVETRAGDNCQDVISNFNDTISTKTLGYEMLEDSYRTDIVTGNATQGIIVYTECSSGLYYAKDDGSLSDAWVQISIDYALNGTNNWTHMGDYKITSNKSSAVRKEFRVDNLPAGEYQVRCKVLARSHKVTLSRACTRIWWSGVASVVYDDFAYPGIALIGIKALATDQISGSPTLKFMVNRPIVYVWNPNTAAYEPKDATNPAWAAYDMVHQCKYLQNPGTGTYEYCVLGAKADLMQYEKFAEWADYCDRFNLKINIEINTSGELLDITNKYVSAVGRGRVDLFGTKYGCDWDGPKDVTQMFGMGNIRAGTFQEGFMQTSDRANAVEVTFTNSQKNYDRDSIKVYGDNFDTDEYDNTTQISYNGITTYEQAYREGKFQLYCNEKMIRTVEFEADIDAIACTLGDRIYVSHDIPKWATSGHILSVDGNTVIVNATIADYDPSATYRLAYRAAGNDTRYETVCSSITVGDDSTTVVMSSIPEVPPTENDIFDIAKNTIGTKSFVVRNITRSRDFVRKIEAIEYNDAVFREDYDVPAIDYTTAAAVTAQNVIGLSGRQILWTSADGIKRARIYLSWSMPQGAGYTRFAIFTSTDKLSWSESTTVTRMSTELDVSYGYAFWVKVVTIYGVSVSEGAVTYISSGIDTQPPDVTALDCEVMASGLRRYWWTFVYPDPNDIAGFRLKYIQGTDVSWEAGIPVQDGLVTQQPYETQTVRQGTHAVMIKAVDNAGNESEHFSYCLLDMGDLLAQNVLFEKDFRADGWAAVTHDGVVDSTTGDLVPLNQTYYWHGPDRPFWAGASEAHWKANWQQYTVDASITAPASGQLWLQYEITGPAIVYYRAYTESYAWSAPEDAAWSAPADSAWPIDGKQLLWKQYSDRVLVTAGQRIDLRIVALNSTSQETTVKALKAYIDVPDETEHFEDVTVPVDGLTLPIQTPSYYTTAVHIDAVQSGNSANAIMRAEIVTRNPCVIKLVDTTGAYVQGVIDVTWQGYIKEVS